MKFRPPLKGMRRSAPALCTIALLLPFSPPSLALESDSSQPIHIESDAAERDERNGITTYSGDVTMTQGTLQILADKVVIKSNGQDVEKVTATGDLAQYQQQPAEDKGLITAKGKTIEYFLSEEKLRISESASVEQSDGSLLTGKVIRYDLKTEVLRADSRDAESTQTSGDRIRMVIPPKQATPTTSDETSN